MPVDGLSSQFQFASWRVPQFPRAIEYPLEVLEDIRAFVCDGLLQRSRAEEEAGGVLFGTRRDDLIRILTWRPIACDHTLGDGLRLSFNDRMNLAVQLEMARQNPDLKDLRPLGWFVSHAGGVALSESDLEIYNGFFPESSQVALVVCPQGGGRARAGFFARETDGKIASESSYQSFDLEPRQPASRVGAPIPATPVAASVAPKPVSAPPPAAPVSPPTPAMQPAVAAPKPPQPAPSPVPRVEPRAEPAKPPPPAREIPPVPLPAPSFQVEETLPTSERWLWAIPILLALGIAAFVLYQRRPPVAVGLHATNEAATVELAWDATSRALRDADSAEIEITDGGKKSQVSLTSDQLQSGKMSYLPQSGDVSFAMTIHPATGDPIHDATRLIAPAFQAPTQAPQLVPGAPAETAAPVGHDALQRQVQQLKDQLAQERAHSTDLQNLIRILETRLGIQDQPPPTTPQHP